MAKKEKTEALVPVEEQPHNLPQNWKWFHLGFVCEFERGITFPASAKESEQTMDNIACLRTANIQEELAIDDLIYVDKSFMKGNDAKLSKVDDIIMSSANSRELVGKVCYVKYLSMPMTFGGFVLTIRASHCFSKFLFYFLRLEFLLGKFMGESTQTTNIANINTTTLSNYAFPMSPFEEQQRIVGCIESLFAKLDEAKEKAQSVVDGFEDRKAAILHKAFTGELTEMWRSSLNGTDTQWRDCLFDDCLELMQNGISKRKGTTGEPFVVLRLANLSEEGFDTNDLREVLLDVKEQRNYVLMKNDVIMIRVNGSKNNVGKQYRMGEQENWAFCDHLIRIRFRKDILPQYMIYFSKTELYRKYIEENMVSSAGQNTISRKGLAFLKVPIPSTDEQKQIVLELDRLFEMENEVKQGAESVIVEIDDMKKSILAKAFRGELGTNDPAESPVELN